MKIVASIQVRIGSSRLPGKVMKELLGKPLLGHLLDRVSSSELLDDIVVATSVNPENDLIEDYCNSRNIACFRGDENDVLGRTLGALKSMNANVGVEVYGDCPLIDPAIVNFMIEKFINDESRPDFVGNDLQTTYPPGMEVEVFKVSALEDSNIRNQDPAIREHGTLFIRQNPEIYKIKNIVAPPEYFLPELELEVDTEEDFYVISKILEHFKDSPSFSLGDIIAFLNSNRELTGINKNIHRRWKEYRDNNDV